jgi:hypothetical protein
LAAVRPAELLEAFKILVKKEDKRASTNLDQLLHSLKASEPHERIDAAIALGDFKGSAELVSGMV